MHIVLFLWTDFMLITFIHLTDAFIQKDINEVADYLF